MSKAAFPPGIQKWPLKQFENGHQNFVHDYSKNASFSLTLPASGNSSDQYKATTNNFKWLISYAIQQKVQLRAIGNGWSFSEVAMCNGGLVDTKALRLSFALKDSFVAKPYLDSGKKSGDLFFVQCGMSILQINEKLEAAGRSLKASGASNGQSIAGATSTGTHGAAFNTGAVHDAIIGLHIITGADRHVWIERSSEPVASDDFIKWLGAEKISDDDVFNAAVVSFGSFGFIHGVLLETAPIFLLEEHKTPEITYDAKVQTVMNTLDFDSIQQYLPYPPDAPAATLYHFEMLVNPHDFEPNNPDKGVYIKTMYKIPYTPNYTKRVRESKGFQYGDNTLGLVQTILDALGPRLSAALVPRLVNAMLPLAFKPSPPAVGTVGETFNNTKFRGKAASAAIAVDIANTTKVLDEMIALNKETPFPGAVSFRYVKGTKALLGFTKFPQSCVIEMDGVDAAVTRNFFKKLWTTLEAKNIPYTMHWGKLNFLLNTFRVLNMYGLQAVNKWIAARHQLMDEKTRAVFTNDFITNCGLESGEFI